MGRWSAFACAARLIAACLATLMVAVAAQAGPLSVNVVNDKGQPLENAVVTLMPKFDLDTQPAASALLEMRQQNTLFAPFVLPVRTGSQVSFPNFDEFRHHVYSFSKAKRFELRLYGKDETNWITFDEPGVVALGCNIHDNMLAYIYVTDAPIYATTDSNGAARFQNLENGAYEIAVWHPGLRRNGAPAPSEILISDEEQSHKVELRIRRVWGEQREPSEGSY